MGIHRCGVSKRMGWHIVNGQSVGDWVAQRIVGGYFAERPQAIGLERDGELIAGVIYENFNHKTIWCHIAIENRITPFYLAAIFDYPFNVAMTEKIIVSVSDSNEESKKLVQKMGFTEEARIKDACVGGDMLFFTLSREKCRFIGDRYGKRLTRPASTT